MKYVFIQFRVEMKIPDGLYNGKYNKEPALITIKESIPSWIQFTNRSAIYEPSGIMHSSVELLLTEQKLNEALFAEDRN